MSGKAEDHRIRGCKCLFNLRKLRQREGTQVHFEPCFFDSNYPPLQMVQSWPSPAPSLLGLPSHHPVGPALPICVICTIAKLAIIFSWVLLWGRSYQAVNDALIYF